MPCLFQKCQLQLCSFITVANVAERYLTAYLHEAAILKKVATLFIIKHYKDVKKTAEFSSILKHPIALMNILDHFMDKGNHKRDARAKAAAEKLALAEKDLEAL